MTRRFPLILATAALAMLLLAGPASADHLRAVVSVSATAEARAEIGYVLTAQVRRSDGRAIGDTRVRFYDLVDFYGPREMFIGAATTDAGGRASLTYLPARTGPREIVALFPGADHLAPVRATMTLDATVAAPPYHAEASGLALFSTRVPYVVGVLVLAVWALIAYAFIGAARGVMAGARTGKGGIT
ncbi:MAG TPA: hypothetical protein VFW12_05270 [Candidatus Limnocylindria bacterium]|nr:hypothetical protein [Candidatus Limnocylindria bacterium]